VNVPQRIVLAIGFLILLIAVLFPPWVFIYKHPELAALERPAGYHLLFGQLVPQDRTELSKRLDLPVSQVSPLFVNISIDQTRLTFEIVGILGLTTILYFLLRSTRR
jgi:hypothetical protein